MMSSMSRQIDKVIPPSTPKGGHAREGRVGVGLGLGHYTRSIEAVIRLYI